MHHDVIVDFDVRDLRIMLVAAPVNVDCLVTQVVDVVLIDAAVANAFFEIDPFISAFHCRISQANFVVAYCDVHRAVSDGNDFVLATMCAELKQAVFNHDIPNVVIVTRILTPPDSPDSNSGGTCVIRMHTGNNNILGRWIRGIGRALEAESITRRLEYL